MVKLLLLFAITALVALSAAKKKQGCGENAEHVECSNQCVATCENPNPQFCLIAPSSCEEGCKCKDGYVQRSKHSSTCIAKDECPNAPRGCGENEELDDCINNPRPCPSASGRPVVGHINPVYCEKGCRCKDGYVFSHKAHKCIPGDRCAKSKKNHEAEKKKGCGKNAEHNKCSNQCVATCENPNPQFCLIAPTSCEEGCKCKKGYVQRSKHSSTCIAKDECPNAPRGCGENEELDDCINNPRPCPNASGRPVVGHINPVYCKEGCRCKDGYVLSRKTHKCVPGDRCAKSKKNNEAETE